MPSNKRFAHLLNEAKEILKANPDMVATFSVSTPELIEELKLHQIELELQNEELKRSRMEVEALHREFADIYEFAPCGYLTLNTTGIISHANLAAIMLLGVERGFLLHSSLIPFIKEGWDSSYLATRKAVSEGRGKQHVTLQLKVRDGNAPKWVLAEINASRDEQENVVGWRVTLVDITERKEAQEQLEAFNQNLQERVETEVALRMKAQEEKQKQEALLVQRSKMADMGEMLGSILHQWKQPLSAISMLTGMVVIMLDKDENVDRIALKNYQEQMYKQIANMVKTEQLFKDFFSPSKEKTIFLACESIEETITIFKPQIKIEDIVIETKEHGHFYVNGYKNELMQVVMNILANARDILKEKSVVNGKIEVSFENDGTTGITRIKDNGGGIPEELLPDRIFESYVTTKGDKGTGIGLNIAKTIIETHLEGKLWAHNIEGGAEFVIELPICDNQTPSRRSYAAQ